MSWLALLILESAVIALSLSIDAFAAGFAYGSKKIKIPVASVHIINLVCAAVIGFSFGLGAIIKPFVPEWMAVALGFGALFFIGLSKLLDSITKSFIQKHTDIQKKLQLSMLNFKIILQIYANPEQADMDQSKELSPAEAVFLAISLSIDGIAVGFGAALNGANGLAIALCSLLTNGAALLLGRAIGQKTAASLPFNISWLGGAVLIFLAFCRL